MNMLKYLFGNLVICDGGHHNTAGLPRSGEKFWKMKNSRSGNFVFSQGNMEKMKKVMEKLGNFKIFQKSC